MLLSVNWKRQSRFLVVSDWCSCSLLLPVDRHCLQRVACRQILSTEVNRCQKKERKKEVKGKKKKRKKRKKAFIFCYAEDWTAFSKFMQIPCCKFEALNMKLSFYGRQLSYLSALHSVLSHYYYDSVIKHCVIFLRLLYLKACDTNFHCCCEVWFTWHTAEILECCWIKSVISSEWFVLKLTLV